jgi:hypothetical protein
MRARRPRRCQIPAVEGTTLGHGAVVDLRGRVECQLYATAPEATEEVVDDMELKESVHDDRQKMRAATT